MKMRGSLPLLILHILASGQNHGYQISKLIKKQSEGILDFKEGTLYPALHSLEKQGLIEAFKEKKNGRTRRYYQLTEAGGVHLEMQRSEWMQFTKAVNQILDSGHLLSFSHQFVRVKDGLL